MPPAERSTTRFCPRVIDPKQAMAPGAPLFIPTAPRESRRRCAAQSRRARCTASSATSRLRSPRPPSIYEATFRQPPGAARGAGDPWRPRLARRPRRAQCPHLDAGAVPDQARARRDIFELPMDKVRVFCERVGGGFGGKQEMFVEDIVALAALQDRTAGQARADPRGAVHRDHDAASDAGPRQGRRRRATASSPRCSSTCSPTPAPTAITAGP